MSDVLLKSFWRRLWAFDMPKKRKLWLRLLSHKAIPVGDGLGVMVGRLAARYLDTLWNRFLIVFGTVQRRLAFGVDVSGSWPHAVRMRELYGGFL